VRVVPYGPLHSTDRSALDPLTKWTICPSSNLYATLAAVDKGYCVMHGQSCDPTGEHFVITTEYLESNKPVAREQLQKAAVRLAHLLDTALGN
jgi:hypothetical protein